MNTFNYISPFAERERPTDGSKLITDKPLSVFDNDFGYWVTANKYLSGKDVVNSFKKITPRDNEIIFLCETDDPNKSNLFGTLFLVKIGSKFKSLLYSLSQGEAIKINSKLNSNSSTSANQVSSFNALLKEIYKYLETNYTSYIEQGYLTFDRLKSMIEDEISFIRQSRRTLGEVMAWQNDGLEYLMKNSDAFFESIMFQKEDYTPEKETDFINTIEDFFSDVAEYILPDDVKELLNQMLSKVKKFIEDKLPEKWKKILLRLQTYMEQALEILNIIANDIYKGYYVIKAFFCGLVNGLLATVQFIIQAFCWLNKNHFSSLFTGELYLTIQSSLESIEDFIDVFYETKDDIIEGMKKLIHDFELESLLAIAKALYGNNESKYTVYDYAYLTGRIIFEIVIAVLLTLFTGGGEAIKLASSLSEMAKLVGRETLSVVSGGIVDFAALLKSFLLKFAQAAKKGWKALQKFFEELLKNKVDDVVESEGKMLDEIAGMAEDIQIRIKMSIEEFEEGLKRLSKISPEEALEYLDDALIYFNHHIVDGRIVQISNRNCVNVVQAVEDFLRTGKISVAKSSEAQSYHLLEKIYQSNFLTYNFSTLNKIMKENERGILLCERGYGKLSHVINIIKKDGKIIFKDGQVYLQEINLLREFKTFKYLKTK